MIFQTDLSDEKRMLTQLSFSCTEIRTLVQYGSIQTEFLAETGRGAGIVVDEI